MSLRSAMQVHYRLSLVEQHLGIPLMMGEAQ